ncbi:accessory gene regulator B family protein [Paenibacillus sp. TRM 82003]|nr:accessory gene regulator B family protein [Paenibacillus sp. TRM 82003]
MITKLSSNIADFIRENHEQSASKDVLMFSIGIVLNSLLVILTVVGISALTGRFGAAVVFLIAYVGLRFVSGGVHLPTSTLCNAFSISIFLVLLHLPIAYWNVGFALQGAAALLILLLAPTKDIMSLNRFGPKFTIHFKVVSFLVVCSNFWMQSPVVAAAFLLQAITLLPWSYRAVSLLERR